MRAGTDARRAEIVDAAYRCVAENGLPGLRMRDVAAAAGVNIATVHYHLTSKEELIRAVVERAHESFARNATPPPSTDPRTRVTAHLRRLFTLLERDPQLGHVLTELALQGERDPVVAEVVAASEARWRTTLQAMLAPIPKPRAAALATLIILTVKGACLPPHDPAALRTARRELTRHLAAEESDLSAAAPAEPPEPGR
ncbi:TetR/AcrR family transcriptional regulator [Asanoa sp. NPDC049573]|uniref:TetR/AcrR family transcriptional regulator n=1 Tax=Asanoa sp. NPDC049573 TaxID=3155396 RepID=UPI0034383E3D